MQSGSLTISRAEQAAQAEARRQRLEARAAQEAQVRFLAKFRRIELPAVRRIRERDAR